MKVYESAEDKMGKNDKEEGKFCSSSLRPML